MRKPNKRRLLLHKTKAPDDKAKSSGAFLCNQSIPFAVLFWITQMECMAEHYLILYR